ncbi:MAG TPA: FMN-binding negative transcriptional regulator [Mycobacteriales bacterium]|nr:FMN-binding negative transcriptional regulator [Mycobacteriales bacterium]
MLVHPWDAADDAEWRSWLAQQSVGTLITRGDPWPVVVPTHFVFDGDATVLFHLARPNPALAAMAADPEVVFSVSGDWAYIPSSWNAEPDSDLRRGIPTSYYAAVILRCRAELLAGEDLVELLRTQLASFEPGSGVVDPAEHGRELPGIRGVRLSVLAAQAKFKYGGNATAGRRATIAANLADRAQGGDLAARDHLQRRPAFGRKESGKTARG